MEKLFSTGEIAGIRFKNRLIRSATHEGMADAEGRPLPVLSELYTKIARGGAGGIITGEAAVSPAGKSSGHHSLMIHHDDLIPAYKELTRAVHEFDTPLVLQLQHCGRQTAARATGTTPIAPSAVWDRFYSEEMPREMDEGDIKGVIKDFAAAVVRAREAGFDGVQYLAAHGYLLSQFLSRYTNRRTDRWGGSLENRFRIVNEIFRETRNAVGDYPLLVKLNAFDARKNGMRIEEAVEISRMLEAAGCDGIEVSNGVFEDGLNSVRGPKLPLDAAYVHLPQYKNFSSFKKKLYRVIGPLLIKSFRPYYNYNVAAAARIKKAVSIPVMVVGGVHRLADMREIVDGGTADYISMSRPFIIEPDIVDRLSSGRQAASRCILCNYCSIGIAVGQLKCYYGKVR